MADRISLGMGNTLAEIGPVVAAVCGFCRDGGSTARDLDHIQLVLDEILTNVVTYAFEPGTTHSVAVSADLAQDRVTVTVEDDGRCYDPLASHNPPDIEASLEDRPIGGLGVYFLKTFMDGSDYQRVDHRNRLRFWKRIGPGQTQPDP